MYIYGGMPEPNKSSPFFERVEPSLYESERIIDLSPPLFQVHRGTTFPATVIFVFFLQIAIKRVAISFEKFVEGRGEG